MYDSQLQEMALLAAEIGIQWGTIGLRLSQAAKGNKQALDEVFHCFDKASELKCQFVGALENYISQQDWDNYAIQTQSSNPTPGLPGDHPMDPPGLVRTGTAPQGGDPGISAG